ncbi:hypothetical protein [uncultured Paracoccus sp.]|uniref:hypothetical protein n=1 Tax=uncultured Paracoccus sp. TaxID=189685 RepID=UPI0025D6CE7A|nr:hypothetical protein [uncultured Paracoccus sp.]
MSVIAAIIAASTAIFIAVVIYPWQKQIDRDNEIAREKRALYWKVSELISSTNRLYDMVLSQENEITNLVVALISVGECKAAKKLIDLNVALRPFHEERDEIRQRGLRTFISLISKRNQKIPAEHVDKLTKTIAELLDLTNKGISSNHVSTIPLRKWIRDHLKGSL